MTRKSKPKLVAALAACVCAFAASEAFAAEAPALGKASQQTGLLRVILGLAVALALAVLAAHPIVRRIERKLGLTVLLSSGLPFVGLGLLFRMPSVGILTEDVVNDLRPALEFGVGWLGFVVGMQFAVRELDLAPEKTGNVVFAESSVPILTTTVTCSLVLFALDLNDEDLNARTVSEFWQNFRGRPAFRDALALGACAAQAAPVAAVAIAKSATELVVGGQDPREGTGSVNLPPPAPPMMARLIDYVSRLDDVAGVILLGFICAFFRPSDAFAKWQIPHIGWLFVTLGMGGVFGIITYVLLRSARNAAEEVACLLGAIALSSGMSGYFGMSPLVTCALAGALLINLPYKKIDRLKATIKQVERPLYLIFLLIAGALWDPSAWQGWVLAPVFVFARVGGKLIGAIWGKRFGPEELPDAGTLGLALSPQSPIAIATIVSYATIYRPASGKDASSLSYLMTACIAGAVLTELVVQAIVRMRGGLKFETSHLDPNRFSTVSLTNEFSVLHTPLPPEARVSSPSVPPKNTKA